MVSPLSRRAVSCLASNPGEGTTEALKGSARLLSCALSLCGGSGLARAPVPAFGAAFRVCMGFIFILTPSPFQLWFDVVASDDRLSAILNVHLLDNVRDGH